MINFFGPLANGDHELLRTDSSVVTVTTDGTGTGILGYKGQDGAFNAYSGAGATLVGTADTEAAVGWRTTLMIQVSGATGDFIVGVGRGGR